MIRERFVPYAVLSFVVIAALTLGTVILRAPDTHGHIWSTVPASYQRTPLDSIGQADLQAIRADLPPFAFPVPPGELVAQVGPGAAAGMADMPGMEVGRSAMSPATPKTQEVSLIQSEYAINPNRVTVKKGVPVELTVKNDGKQVHGLWMPDFGIAEDIRGGRTEKFTFTPDKPGRYRYMCSYNLCGTEEEHARMVGYLTVTD